MKALPRVWLAGGAAARPRGLQTRGGAGPGGRSAGYDIASCEIDCPERCSSVDVLEAPLPAEYHRVEVELIDVPADPVHEFLLLLNRHVAEEAPGDFREENLDHIEPGRVFRGENEQKTARFAGKVLLHFSGHVDAEVVQGNDDQVTLGVVSIQFLQKRDVVLALVILTFPVVHVPRRQVYGRKEGDRPKTHCIRSPAQESGTVCVLLQARFCVLLCDPCGEYPYPCCLPPAGSWQSVSGGWGPRFPHSGSVRLRIPGAQALEQGPVQCTLWPESRAFRRQRRSARSSAGGVRRALPPSPREFPPAGC